MENRTVAEVVCYSCYGRNRWKVVLLLKDQVEAKDKEIDQLREEVRELREMSSSIVNKLKEQMTIVDDSFQRLNPVFLQMWYCLDDLNRSNIGK